jgi:hypothetical protein
MAFNGHGAMTVSREIKGGALIGGETEGNKEGE